MLNNHNYINFETNLEVIHVCNKGRYLNALEEYEIYVTTKSQTDMKGTFNFSSRDLDTVPMKFKQYFNMA